MWNTFSKAKANTLLSPWDKGTRVEDIEKYYDETKYADYTHALSRAPILKAQHPDYEIAQMGIHGQRGVACADCHMPYKSEGGVKFSDHHIQSPAGHDGSHLSGLSSRVGRNTPAECV